MKIKFFILVVVLITAIFGFSFVANAQTTNIQALIAKLQAQIANLMAQLQALQAQQGGVVQSGHKIKFYVDSALVQNIDTTKNYLPGYVEDLNYIFGKTTKLKFNFNQQDITILSDSQINDLLTGVHGSNFPDNFELWVILRKTSPGTIHGLFPGYDYNTGAPVIVIYADGIYNNKNLSPVTLSDWWVSTLKSYWSEVSAIAHETGHAMGEPDYAYLLSAQDTTGVEPKLDISFYNTDDPYLGLNMNDPYWGFREADWKGDPMLTDGFDSEHYLQETRDDLLGKAKFSTLSSAIINGKYGFIFDQKTLPDSNVKIRVIDSNGNLIPNSKIVIYEKQLLATNYFNVLNQDLPNGETTINWQIDRLNPRFRLLKVYADGYNSAVKYVSLIDAQETKLLKNQNNWTITVQLQCKNGACVCAPKWQCGNWSACADNIQTRTCTDLNNCGTTIGQPVTKQTCVVVQPSIIASPTSGTLTGSSPTLWVDFVVKNYTPNGTELVDFGDGTRSVIGYTNAYNSRHDYHLPGIYVVKLLSGTTIVATTQVTVRTPVQPSTTCTDSDAGKDYYTKGTTRYITTGIDDIDDDTCTTSSILGEQYCDNNQQKTILYTCPNGCENGACKQASTQSSITVLSPNGGEKWTIGQTYTLTWTSTGLENVPVDLYVISSDGTVQNNIAIGVQNIGSYVWTIPQNQLEGAQRFYVSSGQISDHSNNIFEIWKTMPSASSISQNSLASISVKLTEILKEILQVLEK